MAFRTTGLVVEILPLYVHRIGVFFLYANSEEYRLNIHEIITEILVQLFPTYPLSVPETNEGF